MTHAFLFEINFLFSSLVGTTKIFVRVGKGIEPGLIITLEVNLFEESYDIKKQISVLKGKIN